jgi:hypothetical protein
VTTVIAVHGLMTRYGAHLAADDLGFTVSEGDIASILSIHRIENKFGLDEYTFESGA